MRRKDFLVYGFGGEKNFLCCIELLFWEDLSVRWGGGVCFQKRNMSAQKELFPSTTILSPRGPGLGITRFSLALLQHSIH